MGNPIGDLNRHETQLHRVADGLKMTVQHQPLNHAVIFKFRMREISTRMAIQQRHLVRSHLNASEIGATRLAYDLDS